MSNLVMPGSTPTHTFTMPFEVEAIQELCISYSQNGVELFTKCLSDCESEGYDVSVTLSQEETLQFDCNYPLDIQVKVLTAGPYVLVSDVISRSEVVASTRRF